MYFIANTANMGWNQQQYNYQFRLLTLPKGYTASMLHLPALAIKASLN